MKVRPPSFLQRLNTDEFIAPAYSPADERAIARASDEMDAAAHLRGESLARLMQGRAGTAAGLRALNVEAGTDFYQIPADAVLDDAAAEEAFRGQGLVIDVQTHFMTPRSVNAGWHQHVKGMFDPVKPDWWTESDDLVDFNIAEYLANVFIESETAVAVLTSGPGIDDSRSLFNDEMAATRLLLERFGGTGRLFNHAVVHADLKDEYDAMAEWSERFSPVGWKVYTQGRYTAEGRAGGWSLDDEKVGIPFLERARDLGVPLICAHKGISAMVDNGTPRDIGPAARMFPDLSFVIYHSAYEFTAYGAPPEGPFSEKAPHYGVNRLIQSAIDVGLGVGCNIYPELGSTWFALIRHPEQAAHVLGKLIAHFGEDNVIWGTDGIWYGSSQPIIDAFRAFQIPDWMCADFGYRPLTAQTKEKILSLNAARLYGIDLAATHAAMAGDDLAWAKASIADYRANGMRNFVDLA